MKSFRSSGRFRVNANGKRLDAWLIYKCTSCDFTWNRPILERRDVRSIDARLLAMLHASDPELAHRTAFDAGGLRRCSERIGEAGDFSVRKKVLSKCANPRQVEIVCQVPFSVGLRLDRLLAAELRISRSRISSLAKSGALRMVPGAPHALRRPAHDGMRLMLTLPPNEAARFVEAAVGGEGDFR
jgi:hypothetical protein